jgi:ATP-dependent DNA helicase PIF1
MQDSSFLGELLAGSANHLNRGQNKALQWMGGSKNVFLSGGAGTGKSFLIKEFMRGVDASRFPLLASTGAAAVLLGGRTFHSFFGLGILEGGVLATMNRALKDRRLARRLKKVKGFILDEVSMVSGEAFDCAEKIARLFGRSDEPWGGLKVICVGDFAQLPPISRKNFDDPHSQPTRDWAFLTDAWKQSDFQSLELDEIMRAQEDKEFCEVLNDLRWGKLTSKARNLLDWRKMMPSDEEADLGTYLYSRKMDVERINLRRLEALPGKSKTYETEYLGAERYTKILRGQAPVPEKIEIKKGALVMCRQNDPKGRWVNGSLGTVLAFDQDEIELQLLSGSTVSLDKVRFTMLDADGHEVAVAKNFPLTLAYAITIHKAQGATLDQVTTDLSRLWEPGQAYVALSRVRNSAGLFLNSWDENSIFTDSKVRQFYESLPKASQI